MGNINYKTTYNGRLKLTKFASDLRVLQNEISTLNDKVSQFKVTLGSKNQLLYVLVSKEDHIHISCVPRSKQRVEKSFTHCTVLSFIYSIFFLVGLVAPYTVRARFLL